MVDPHAFMDALREFHHNQGEDLKLCDDEYATLEYFLMAPIFNRRVMDLKKLWELVFAHGGSHQVCLKKRWASIGRCFNPPPSMTNLSFHIKRIFERYLLPFEQLHFPERAMKTQGEAVAQSASRVPPGRKQVEMISPAFDRPIYIPRKKRSKLTRGSKYGRSGIKISRSDSASSRKTMFSRTINPKDFAMPQTLVRTSVALNVDVCEMQAASALQQMKGFPTLSDPCPAPVTSLPSFLDLSSTLSIPKLSELPPQLGQHIRSMSTNDQVFESTNEIYLSNGIRVIPIKPTADGFIPIHIERPTPELRPTSVIPSSASAPEMDTTRLEQRQSREIERLRKQVQQMQSVILRQESKIQATESSCEEFKERFQALVANFTSGGGSSPL